MPSFLNFQKPHHFVWDWEHIFAMSKQSLKSIKLIFLAKDFSFGFVQGMTNLRTVEMIVGIE